MKLTLICKILIAYLVLNNISCGKPPCECDFIGRQYIEIKFINQQQQNLIFGSTALYQIDSMQVLKEKGSFNISNSSVRKGTIDSNNVEFDFYIPAGKSYIYYNQQTQPDSLETKWLVKTAKCCGNLQEYYIIDSVKFNNIFIKAVDGVYYFIK